jgi:2-polyprenyl-6-methoxyphenol hydroxylase-like FAD-dependent oxidoreductase
MLAKCLPSSVAHYGFECVGIEAEHEHVKVRFQNGYTDTADLLIGADGINSVVRRSLLGRVEPRYAGYTCWRGICRRPTSLADGYVAEWWGRGRRFGIGALPNERIYWWATENTAAGDHTDDQRHLIEAFHDWAEPVPELIATTPKEKILRNDIVDRPPDRRWVSGRAVLVGDAAHPTTPNLGQGGCMAIEDAVVLGRWLQQGGDIRRVLESFVAERFDRTASITRTSWHFGWLGQADGRLTSWLRDRILRIVMPFAGPQSLLRYAQFDVGSLAPNREL